MSPSNRLVQYAGFLNIPIEKNICKKKKQEKRFLNLMNEGMIHGKY